MSRLARRALYAQVRAEHSAQSARFVDLRADFRSYDGERHFLAVGGKWDRLMKDFSPDGDAATGKLFQLHPGQYEVGEWFARWLDGHIRKKPLKEHGKVMRSLLLAGGRRAGKSDYAIKAAVAYAVAIPKSRVWIVAPSIPETEEIELALLDWLPRAWYKRLGAPWYRFLFPNWSTVTLRSAHDPEVLKRGRADFVVMNEAQKMHERAFAILRPSTADKGGLIILTANPPEEPIGQWVADFVEECRAERRPAKYIHVDARKNPFVDQGALDDLALEVDERTYRMERDGEFLARLDIAFYAWSPTLNVVPTPDVGDMTREWTAARFGREGGYDYVAGFDFQLHPHMAVCFFKAFRDPFFPDADPILWAVDYAAIKGNEDELFDELARRGYDGSKVACVPDASGEYQDAERTRGRGSCDIMRRRNWGHIFLPDPKSKRNPDITERVAVANARICTADHVRHVFSDPRNLELNIALRKWEMRNGAPHRKSPYAHLCDAFSYPLFRLYPRRTSPGPFRHDRIQREARGGWEDIKGKA
jgi:hypothetical protein